MKFKIIPISLLFLFAFLANINSQVTFDLPNAAGAPGSNICVPVTVQNFTDIQSYQLSIVYDQSVLTYTNIIFDLPGTLAAANETVDAINISWVFSFIYCTSLPDDDVLFQLCFDVNGSLGDISPLTISDGSPPFASPAEASDCYAMSTPIDISDIGTVIVALDLTGDIGTCNTANNTTPVGSIQVAMTTGSQPFTGTYSEVGNPGNSGIITFIGENGSSPNNLTSGNYTINVTDTNGEMLNANGHYKYWSTIDSRLR